MRLLNGSHTGIVNGKLLSNFLKKNLDEHNFRGTLKLFSLIQIKIEVSLLVSGSYTIGEGILKVNSGDLHLFCGTIACSSS